MTDEQIEALAIEHEAFGFGRVDDRGLTTHGFDPDGLRDFARAILSRTPAPSEPVAWKGLSDEQRDELVNTHGFRGDCDEMVDIVSDMLRENNAVAPSGGVPTPATPAGAPRLSSIQRDHDEIAEAFRTAPLYGAPAQSADMVPSLSELNELATVYASSYASPHHITFTVAGLRSLIAAAAGAPTKASEG